MSQYEFEYIFKYISNDLWGLYALLEAYFEPIGYRYIGVHVGSLKDAKQIVEQVDLFEVPQENTDFILNRLNAKMDSKCFIKASDLLKQEGSN